jgi:uncharacterized protein (DUF427 family)
MKRYVFLGTLALLVVGLFAWAYPRPDLQPRAQAQQSAAQSAPAPIDCNGECESPLDAVAAGRRTSGLDAGFLDETNRLHWATGPRWVGTAKRIRVYFGGVAVADSTRAYLLRDRSVPVYYFPESDVKKDLFVPSQLVRNAPLVGDASYSSIKVGDRVAQDAVWTYRNPIAGAEFLKGYVGFEWGKMDMWFEDKDQVFVHARDPFLRIDTVHTDRHIKVVLNGVTVGESDNAVMLLEPGQPIRYYMPVADTKLDFLRPSDTTSRCPYKGLANYYSMEVGGKRYDDVIWSYRAPTLESEKIAGLISFYNEKVDAIYVDGQELAKPLERNRGGRSSD